MSKREKLYFHRNYQQRKISHLQTIADCSIIKSFIVEWKTFIYQIKWFIFHRNRTHDEKSALQLWWCFLTICGYDWWKELNNQLLHRAALCVKKSLPIFWLLPFIYLSHDCILALCPIFIINCNHQECCLTLYSIIYGNILHLTRRSMLMSSNIKKFKMWGTFVIDMQNLN